MTVSNVRDDDDGCVGLWPQTVYESVMESVSKCNILKELGFIFDQFDFVLIS